MPSENRMEISSLWEAWTRKLLTVTSWTKKRRNQSVISSSGLAACERIFLRSSKYKLYTSAQIFQSLRKTRRICTIIFLEIASEEFFRLHCHDKRDTRLSQQISQQTTMSDLLPLVIAALRDRALVDAKEELRIYLETIITCIRKIRGFYWQRK